MINKDFLKSRQKVHSRRLLYSNEHIKEIAEMGYTEPHSDFYQHHKPYSEFEYVATHSQGLIFVEDSAGHTILFSPDELFKQGNDLVITGKNKLIEWLSK